MQRILNIIVSFSYAIFSCVMFNQANRHEFDKNCLSSFSDCETFFGGQYESYIRSDDSVICTTEYSKVVPLEGGEVRRT